MFRTILRPDRLAALLVAAVTATAGVPAIANAATTTVSACSVANQRLVTAYASIQLAVNAAATGDTLDVHGTCVGNLVFDVGRITATRLTLAGAPGAILDGNGASAVIWVGKDHTLTITGLTIRNGTGRSLYPAGPVVGGGIINLGSLVLRDVAIRGNSAAGMGGGIYNAFGARAILWDSQVTLNSAVVNGGGVRNEGRLVLRGTSSINRNTVTGDGGLGGGVYAAAASFLVLRDRSTVRDNMAVGIGGRGGGILDEFSTINGAPCTARGNEHVFANSPRNCAGI